MPTPNNREKDDGEEEEDMCIDRSLLSDLDNIAGLRQCHRRRPLWRKDFPRRFSEARRYRHRLPGNRYRSLATTAADRLGERSRPPCSDAFAGTASVSAV